MDVPVWVYFVVLGIIFSALMAVKTGRDERLAEDAEIEKEGEIYIKRMEEERERRKRHKAVSIERNGFQ